MEQPREPRHLRFIILATDSIKANTSRGGPCRIMKSGSRAQAPEMVKFNERLNAILIDSRVYLFSALGFLNAMRCAVCLRCLGAAAALGVLRAQVSLVP